MNIPFFGQVVIEGAFGIVAGTLLDQYASDVFSTLFGPFLEQSPMGNKTALMMLNEGLDAATQITLGAIVLSSFTQYYNIGGSKSVGYVLSFTMFASQKNLWKNISRITGQITNIIPFSKGFVTDDGQLHYKKTQYTASGNRDVPDGGDEQVDTGFDQY